MLSFLVTGCELWKELIEFYTNSKAILANRLWHNRLNGVQQPKYFRWNPHMWPNEEDFA